MDWGIILQQFFSQSIGVNAMVFAMAAIGLNIHFGFTGLLNFGHVGFMAAGAYGVGVTVFWWDLNFWLGIGVGVIFSVVLALVLGIPTLRLRSDYLGITTIAASEALRIFVRWRGNTDRTGASEGINDFADAFFEFNIFTRPGNESYNFFFFEYRANDLWVMLIGWSLVGFFLLLNWQLIRSPWGRALKSIREDEDAARALGKNAYSYKMQALVLGGVIGGFAGMIQVISRQSVQPDTFNPVITFLIWTILIIGGVGKVWSPVAGSVIYWALISGLITFMRELIGTDFAPQLERWTKLSVLNVDQLRFVVFGAVLMLLMWRRPQGVFGNREEMALDDR